MLGGPSKIRVGEGGGGLSADRGGRVGDSLSGEGGKGGGIFFSLSALIYCYLKSIT